MAENRLAKMARRSAELLRIARNNFLEKKKLKKSVDKIGKSDRGGKLSEAIAVRLAERREQS